jgi:DNA polymerase III subunit delta'
MILEDIDFLFRDGRNQANLKILKNSLLSGNLSHCYLFSGNHRDLLYKLALNFAASINCPEKGCGKCVVCKNTLKEIYVDLQVIEAEGIILKKGKIKELQNFMGTTSYLGGKKISIVNGIEEMNKESSNMILKILEEPPDENSIFILLTGNISAVLPTIASRCMVFEWNFNLPEVDDFTHIFPLLCDIMDNGIKQMIKDASINNYSKNLSFPIDLSLKVFDMFKENYENVKSEYKKEISEIEKIGASQTFIENFEETIEKRIKAKMAKFNNLGINKVFDIITAWLEDIASVGLGAEEKSLNFCKNFLFIKEISKRIKIEKIPELVKLIENNRNYLKYSIYPELALDNILVQFQNLI